MKWANLQNAWLLLPAALVLFFAWRERLLAKGIFFSGLSTWKAASPTLAARLRHLPLALRTLAVGLLVIAALRPQALMGENEVKLKGVNIVLTTDMSGSMVAEDLKPDRLAAEKKVLTDFVRQVKYDNVGLVIFGAKAFTQSPLTMDYDILSTTINEIDLNTVDADGTAIGDGIICAANRLSQYENQTNIIILATDGTNNKGEDPLKAAEIAAKKRIRIYAVGIGAKGGAPIYIKDQFGAKQPYTVKGQPQRWDEPNDKVLKEVAVKTGGEYYRATDEKDLKNIYDRISKLIKDEKKRRDPQYKELFSFFLAGALACLILEMLLSATWLRSLN